MRDDFGLVSDVAAARELLRDFFVEPAPLTEPWRQDSIWHQGDGGVYLDTEPPELPED